MIRFFASSKSAIPLSKSYAIMFLPVLSVSFGSTMPILNFFTTVLMHSLSTFYVSAMLMSRSSATIPLLDLSTSPTLATPMFELFIAVSIPGLLICSMLICAYIWVFCYYIYNWFDNFIYLYIYSACALVFFTYINFGKTKVNWVELKKEDNIFSRVCFYYNPFAPISWISISFFLFVNLFWE